MFDIYTDVHFDSHNVCVVTYRGNFCFGGNLTKPSISIARIDRFYLNLVISLQLDIALLVQNLLKSDIVCWSYDNVYRGYRYFFPGHSVY